MARSNETSQNFCPVCYSESRIGDGPCHACRPVAVPRCYYCGAKWPEHNGCCNEKCAASLAADFAAYAEFDKDARDAEVRAQQDAASDEREAWEWKYGVEGRR
jgi:hypothetical protein